MYYIIESADWVIRWIGNEISEKMNSQKLLKTIATNTHACIHNQIIHFGSRNFLLRNSWRTVDSSNKIVLSWYHGSEKDKTPSNLAMIKTLPEACEKVDVIHTACKISREKLINWGVPEEKIVLIPFGVNLEIFKHVSVAQKNKIRKTLGLPQDKIVIGSFQKDGLGWGEGLEPKLVKGPDIFVEVVDRLYRDYDIIAFILGPARGYVKRELEKRGVPYLHDSTSGWSMTSKFYHALDLYLVTSREEGGPLAILEAMATGVPLVSTKVGMSPDVIIDGYNGLLSELEDVHMLVRKATSIIEDKELAYQLVANGLKTVKNYSWEKICRRHYEEIYSRFITT